MKACVITRRGRVLPRQKLQLHWLDHKKPNATQSHQDMKKNSIARGDVIATPTIQKVITIIKFEWIKEKG
jgi:hypothetical protein